MLSGIVERKDGFSATWAEYDKQLSRKCIPPPEVVATMKAIEDMADFKWIYSKPQGKTPNAIYMKVKDK